jgi:threonine-phosphate decarboxylase
MLHEPMPAEHGGDLSAISLRYGIPRDRLLDFSANINPLGPPASLLRAFVRAARDRDELSRYPDDAHGGLVRALATRFSIDPACIVIGNGAAALLDAAVRVRPIARCLIPEPAFSEDRRALAVARTEAVTLRLDRRDGFRLDASTAIETMRDNRCDACLITNPNNPSGSLATHDDIAKILEGARDLGALAIVDEAFIDYAPAESVLDIAAVRPETIVIRSLTKFFSVPALRVGYAVCEPSLAGRLRATLAPWPVTAAVSRALVAALTDSSYERRSLSRNARERDHLTRRLRRFGFGVTDASANFLLVELPPGAPLATHVVDDLIARERIVVRDCTRYGGLESGRFFRVAVRGRRDADRLVGALRRSLNRSSS